MKRSTILTLALLAAAGVCLAQSDSAKPAADSAKVKVQVEQRNDSTTTVTVTSEPGKTDSTTTVTIRSGERDRRMMHRYRWALGMRASSLLSLPGSIVLQRIVGRNLFLGCGFEYKRNPSTSGMDIPTVNYGNYDNQYGNGENRNSYSSWSISISPECLIRIASFRKYRLLSGLSGEYKYYLVRGSNYYSHFNATDTMYQTITGKARCSVYSISMPMILERGFRVGGQTYFVGLQTKFVSLDYSRELVEWDQIYHPTSGPIETTSTGYYIAYPLRVSIKNPFQGEVSLLVKWYI